MVILWNEKNRIKIHFFTIFPSYTEIEKTKEWTTAEKHQTYLRAVGRRHYADFE